MVTKKVRRCEYDFYPYMNRAGDYTFQVRALGAMEDERGMWSDKSEEITLGRTMFTGERLLLTARLVLGPSGEVKARWR